ncbi:phosphoribosylamine--glycine ligase [Megasphaera elsdenii CAG:570]|uniref:Glycinamide ribonucleotide synthetase n=2 Tax=Megasphaera elsdenii TaxID=907 RepID=R7MVN8_MEGEL|nr:phosphoribosylamine--glycine ligase [Megasphaera elsdenii CAG:570]
MYACAKGTLTADMVHWKDAAACCVIMASAGYPASSHKGDVISGLDAVDKEDVMVFHSGTAKKDGQYVTNGGRVLGVTAVAPDLKSAIEKAYANVKRIHFDGQQVRSDIGAKGLKHLK